MASNFAVQSGPNGEPPEPLHVAIIMDGNGRWALARGHSRSAGHRAGVGSLTRVVEAAPTLGIGTLTVYAFSSDNWSRPEREVWTLLDLMREALRDQIGACVANGIRVRVIGRRDRLPAGLVAAIESVEAATASGTTMQLRVAIDYSSRDAILAAARATHGAALTRDTFARSLATPASAPDVDLLIRTGGEQRLSDFLLWESAYAELVFVETTWPEFTPADLADAISRYHQRERRFGGLTGGHA